jgi:hypothetical protein
MTAIATATKITGSGNNSLQNAFDVIFPGITVANDPTNALASHPRLEVWANTALDSIVAGTGDNKVFWSTSPTYDVGPLGSTFLGSSLRAIPTYNAVSGADWAINDNCTGGTAFPAAGKARCLRGNVDYLPLLPDTENFLGDNNVTLVNRCMFNLACAIHGATSTTYGDLTAYITVRYTYLDTDPGMSIRGNTNTSGEPSLTSITSLNHTHMKSIFGGDADLVAGGDRTINFSDNSASNTLPGMELPTSGFKYSEKIVALVP